MPFYTYSNGYVEYRPANFQGPYPVSSMPAEIGEAIVEVSDNYKLPVEVCAHAALEVISLICSLFIKIRVAPYDPALVSLYLMLIIKSGFGKSVPARSFSRSINAFERKQSERYETALATYKAEQKMWEEDGQQQKKQYRQAAADSSEVAKVRNQRLEHEKNRPVAPKKTVLRYSQPTPEALRDAFVTNHSILVANPDAEHILNGQMFSQPTVLCGYWSGDNVSVGLVSGDRRLSEPGLTLSFMTQQHAFESYMNNRGEAAFSAGLLARFLVIELPGGKSDEAAQFAEISEPKLDEFNQRSERLLEQDIPAPDNRQILGLTADAELYAQLFKNWVQHHRIQGNFSDELKSFFRKIVQQSTRIAALLHYFSGRSGDVSGESMKSAIALSEWYLAEFIRVFEKYAPSQQQRNEAVAQQLLEWLEEATSQPHRYRNLTLGQYTERDLRNYAIRKDPEKLRLAIQELAWRGYITVGQTLRGATIVYYPAHQQITSFASSYSPMSSPLHSPFGIGSSVSVQKSASAFQQVATPQGHNAAQCQQAMNEFGNSKAGYSADGEILMGEIRGITDALPQSSIEANAGPILARRGFEYE